MAQDTPPGHGNLSSDAVVSVGEGIDIITIRRVEGLVLIEVGSEVTGATIIAAMKEALEKGVIDLRADALVDLRSFVGVIDWPALHVVRDLTAWGTTLAGPTRVAYIIRDGTFANIVKLISALFLRTKHRAFSKREAALAWLKTPRRGPPAKKS